MLYGGYDHSLDKKGRISIPAKLREELGNDFMICPCFTGKCLSIYPNDEWNRLVGKIGELPLSKSGGIKRMLYGSAFHVEPDAQGRILIPPLLREYAGLESNVHFAGVDTSVEVWDAGLWEAEHGGFTAESIAQAVKELNF